MFSTNLAFRRFIKKLFSDQPLTRLFIPRIRNSLTLCLNIVSIQVIVSKRQPESFITLCFIQNNILKNRPLRNFSHITDRRNWSLEKLARFTIPRMHNSPAFPTLFLNEDRKLVESVHFRQSSASPFTPYGFHPLFLPCPNPSGSAKKDPARTAGS